MYDCNIPTVFPRITFISVIDAKVIFLNRQCVKLKKVKPSYSNVSLPYSVLCSVKWHSETLCSVSKVVIKVLVVVYCVSSNVFISLYAI